MPGLFNIRLCRVISDCFNRVISDCLIKLTGYLPHCVAFTTTSILISGYPILLIGHHWHPIIIIYELNIWINPVSLSNLLSISLSNPISGLIGYDFPTGYSFHFWTPYRLMRCHFPTYWPSNRISGLIGYFACTRIIYVRRYMAFKRTPRIIYVPD